jgi:hypothetical protein
MRRKCASCRCTDPVIGTRDERNMGLNIESTQSHIPSLKAIEKSDARTNTATTCWSPARHVRGERYGFTLVGEGEYTRVVFDANAELCS